MSQLRVKGVSIIPLLHWRVIFGNVGLDIENRGAGHQIEARNFQLGAANGLQLAERQADGVGPVRRPRRKKADPLSQKSRWSNLEHKDPIL